MKFHWRCAFKRHCVRVVLQHHLPQPQSISSILIAFFFFSFHSFVFFSCRIDRFGLAIESKIVHKTNDFAWDAKNRNTNTPHKKTPKSNERNRSNIIKRNEIEQQNWNIITIITEEIGKHIQIGANQMPLMLIHSHGCSWSVLSFMFAILMLISSATQSLFNYAENNVCDCFSLSNCLRFFLGCYCCGKCLSRNRTYLG